MVHEEFSLKTDIGERGASAPCFVFDIIRNRGLTPPARLFLLVYIASAIFENRFAVFISGGSVMLRRGLLSGLVLMCAALPALAQGQILNNFNPYQIQLPTQNAGYWGYSWN